MKRKSFGFRNNPHDKEFREACRQNPSTIESILLQVGDGSPEFVTYDRRISAGIRGVAWRG